jgi:hypothetical protein
MLLTLIAIASLDPDEMDVQNQHTVSVPFGEHPVNDRIIYEPLQGAKMGATKRFEWIGS